MEEFVTPREKAMPEKDAKLYYPPDVYRMPNPIFRKDFKIDIKQMLRDKIVSKIRSVFDDDE